MKQAFTFVFALLCCNILTAATQVVGNFTLTYTITDGNATITDCSNPGLLSYTIIDGKATITDCSNASEALTLPDTLGEAPVTTIGKGAFRKCFSLTSVTMPDSVTTIEDRAFEACSSLTSLTFEGDAPEKIHDLTFNGTHSDLVIYYEEGTTGWRKSWWNLFSKRDSWSGIETKPFSARSVVVDGIEWHYTVENGCAIIGSNRSITKMPPQPFLAISEKTVGEIVIPTELNGFPVIAIGTIAFKGCSGLTSITIPEGVTSIGDGAFGDCRSLTSITIPDRVKTIGDGAFWDCSSLVSVAIGNNVTTIGDCAFYDCASLTSVTIPDRVITIGDGAFYRCASLTSVTIPDRVTTIGDGAFFDCSSLTSVTIGDGVMTIGESAFAGHCSSLEISNYIFVAGSVVANDCSSLTNIFVKQHNSSFSSLAGVLFDKKKATLFQYPCGKESSTYIIPDTVTTIGKNAFSYCSRLTSVMIPDSVMTIEKDAFRGCSSLANATIPDGVTTIGDYAFSYCSSLSLIIFDGDKPAIESEAFSSIDEKAIGLYHSDKTGWTEGERIGNLTMRLYDDALIIK